MLRTLSGIFILWILRATQGHAQECDWVDAEVELRAAEHRFGERHATLLQARARVEALAPRAAAAGRARVVACLRRKLVEVRATRARERVRFGPRHPTMMILALQERWLQEALIARRGASPSTN